MRASSLTSVEPSGAFSALETVAFERPHRRATSRMVGLGASAKGFMSDESRQVSRGFRTAFGNRFLQSKSSARFRNPYFGFFAAGHERMIRGPPPNDRQTLRPI